VPSSPLSPPCFKRYMPRSCAGVEIRGVYVIAAQYGRWARRQAARRREAIQRQMKAKRGTMHCTPVQRARKFSAVRGASSLKRLKMIRPAEEQAQGREAAQARC